MPRPTSTDKARPEHRPARLVSGAAFVLGLSGLALLPGCARDPAPVLEVSGSPDEGLVFTRVRQAGGQDLWRARLADGAVRPLIVTPERDESWPYWSQAAGALVFEVSAGAAQERRLRLWRASDASERPFPEPPSSRQSWAAWAPDGRRLAFARRSPSAGGLAVIELSSQAASLWAANRPRLSFLRPVFTSDGKRVVAQGREKRSSRLYLLAPGRLPTPLTPASGFAYRASLTRDGEWCVFTDRGVGAAASRIAAVRLDGSGLRGLGGRRDVHSERVNASPTRDEVVFVSDRDGALDVFRMDFPDGEPHNLTKTLDLDAGPLVWSPDGDRIAVVMKPTGGGRAFSETTSDLSSWLVVVLDREGQELFRTSGFAPDWMPGWP